MCSGGAGEEWKEYDGFSISVGRSLPSISVTMHRFYFHFGFNNVQRSRNGDERENLRAYAEISAATSYTISDFERFYYFRLR